MGILQYFELTMIWLLICYLLAGFILALVGFFTNKHYYIPPVAYLIIMFIYPYSLYHWWRDRK